MPIVDGETDGTRLQDLLVSYMKQVLRRIFMQIFLFFRIFAFAVLTKTAGICIIISVSVAKPNNNRYFNDLFDKGIVGYFENVVMRDYGSELVVDVITAIENEADYEGRFEEEDNAYALIDQYVRKVIEDTRKLSCPFIESPMGEAREPIDCCQARKSVGLSLPARLEQLCRPKVLRPEDRFLQIPSGIPNVCR